MRYLILAALISCAVTERHPYVSPDMTPDEAHAVFLNECRQWYYTLDETGWWPHWCYRYLHELLNEDEELAQRKRDEAEAERARQAFEPKPYPPWCDPRPGVWVMSDACPDCITDECFLGEGEVLVLP